MKNKECNVIRDLLPNYMESLTSNDTKIYIENHIKECKECKAVLQNMNDDCKIEKEDKKSRDFVDYAKKYNRKFKSLKFLVISIILLVIVIFIASTTRKYIILSSCIEKSRNILESTNYHRRFESYSESGIHSQEILRKDNKYLYVASYYDKNTHEAFYPQNPILYYDGQKTYWYSEDNLIKAKIYHIEYDNKFETLLVPDKLETSKLLLKSIFSRIDTETMNGKECYRVIPSKIVNLEKFDLSNDIYYLDKDTGVCLRNISADRTNNLNKYNLIAETSIELNTVTDEDLVVPNVQEYKSEDDEEIQKLYEKMLEETETSDKISE